MRGGLSGPQAQKVIRHLLAGCGQCTRITGQLWELGEPSPGLIVLAEEMDRMEQRHRYRAQEQEEMPAMMDPKEMQAKLLEIFAEIDRGAPRRPDRLREEGGLPVMKATAGARAQLLEIKRQLEAIRFRLLGVQASLPPAPAELVPLLEEENMDAAAQIRAVVQCVLHDSIEPAIQDLGELASLPEEPR